MTTKPDIKTAFAFPSGSIAVFDSQGQQIPELQVNWLTLWALHAEALGYVPVGVTFECQNGEKWRITLTNEGYRVTQ